VRLQYTFNYLTEKIYNEEKGEEENPTSHENEVNININPKTRKHRQIPIPALSPYSYLDSNSEKTESDLNSSDLSLGSDIHKSSEIRKTEAGDI
jgi:hypothetical protein